MKAQESGFIHTFFTDHVVTQEASRGCLYVLLLNRMHSSSVVATKDCREEKIPVSRLHDSFSLNILKLGSYSYISLVAVEIFVGENHESK